MTKLFLVLYISWTFYKTYKYKFLSYGLNLIFLQLKYFNTHN